MYLEIVVLDCENARLFELYNRHLVNCASLNTFEKDMGLNQPISVKNDVHRITIRAIIQSIFKTFEQSVDLDFVDCPIVELVSNDTMWRIGNIHTQKFKKSVLLLL